MLICIQIFIFFTWNNIQNFLLKSQVYLNMSCKNQNLAQADSTEPQQKYSSRPGSSLDRIGLLDLVQESNSKALWHIYIFFILFFFCLIFSFGYYFLVFYKTAISYQFFIYILWQMMNNNFTYVYGLFFNLKWGQDFLIFILNTWVTYMWC